MSHPRGRTALDCAKERFWQRVQKTDLCWLWTGRKDKDGYGVLMVNCKKIRAHRFSFVIAGGVVPDGFLVCHHCDNTSCVRPDHLFAGTDLDNNRDMQAKGRGANRRGEKSGTAKLTSEQVLRIRSLRGVIGYKRLAKMFGVGSATIQRIQNGSTWKHLLAARQMPTQEQVDSLEPGTPY